MMDIENRIDEAHSEISNDYWAENYWHDVRSLRAENTKLKESNLLLTEEAKDKDRMIRDLGKRAVKIEGENRDLTRELAVRTENYDYQRQRAEKLEADLAKARSDLAAVRELRTQEAERREK